MKVRKGFVSNSSSTSFAIVYEDVTKDEFLKLKKKDVEKEDIYLEPTDGREIVCDGCDLIPVNWEIFKHIKEKWLINNFDIIKIFEMNSEYHKDDKEFNREDMPEKFKLKSLERSNHYTSTFIDFKERYNDEG